ncbi:hypothetical protein [Falsihalocynthiibacter arcticus]|nr:hypothetical protein [Falsihalocynthiibacter arcticus]
METNREKSEMRKDIETVRPLPQSVMRQPDGGGSEVDDDKSQIELVLIGGKAHCSGYLSKAEFTALINKNEFKAIAFQKIGWHKGDYHSSWVPYRIGE